MLNGLPYDVDLEYRLAAIAAWERTGKGLPTFALRLLGLGGRASAQSTFMEKLVRQRYRGDGKLSSTLKALRAHDPDVSADELRYPPPPDDKTRAQLYAKLALCYEANGRIEQALEAWHFSGIAAGLYVPCDQRYRADRKQGWSDVSASSS